MQAHCRVGVVDDGQEIAARRRAEVCRRRSGSPAELTRITGRPAVVRLTPVDDDLVAISLQLVERVGRCDSSARRGGGDAVLHLFTFGERNAVRDSIRADIPDGAVPGGEPDIAFPVRSEAGDVVVGGNRTTEIDYIREFQPPTAVRILRMGNADQLTVSVDGYETVLVVEVGVDAAEQTALRERQLCYGSTQRRGVGLRIDQMDGRDLADHRRAERDDHAVGTLEDRRAGGHHRESSHLVWAGSWTRQRSDVGRARVTVHGGSTDGTEVRICRCEWTGHRRGRRCGSGTQHDCCGHTADDLSCPSCTHVNLNHLAAQTPATAAQMRSTRIENQSIEVSRAASSACARAPDGTMRTSV